MFQEYDIVRAKINLNVKVIVETKGTVLIVHNSIPPQYEVEFMDKSGGTIDILTVKESDIK